ncbi:response regulator transcription factor [Fusibacter sp. JL216-2]|uniref:response regulator transcription factor n=1 Tax=Fusibacter sp. JL216-2 TaxID=3071453 RepID=UPI003D34B98F
MTPKILIAEDDTDIRELIRMHLEKDDYRVEAADNGLKALEMFKSSHFDLIILDIMMPGLTGIELLRHIRQTSEVPVLMLTARDADHDKILGLDLGADDYITKPFSIFELSSRVRAHLRRYLKFNHNPDLRGRVLKSGPITIDEEKHEVIIRDKRVDLNPTEFKILTLFVQAPGRVYTKRQIYEYAWEENYYGDDNTIMVHISHLREKIEIDPKNPSLIKTIRGVGYRLES